MFVRSAKKEREKAREKAKRNRGTERKKFFTFSFMAIKINPQTEKQTTKRKKGNKQVRKSFFIN